MSNEKKLTKIKVFKSHISEVADTNNIESSVNAFIKNKTIIDIKQSLVPKIQEAAKRSDKLYFVMITVMYQE